MDPFVDVDPRFFTTSLEADLGLVPSDLPNWYLPPVYAEDLPPQPQPLVTAQALATPEQAVAWMLPWAAPGGTLALPLSVDQAPPGALAGIDEVSVIPYSVPLGGLRRVVWLARRAK